MSGLRQLLVGLALTACGTPSSNPSHPDPIGSSSSGTTPVASSTTTVSAPNGCSEALHTAWLANGDLALACGKDLRVLDSSLAEQRRVDTGLQGTVAHLARSSGSVLLVDSERNWRLLDAADLSQQGSGTLPEESPGEYQISPSGKHLAMGVQGAAMQIVTLASGGVSSIDASGSYPFTSMWLADDTLALCDRRTVRLARVGSAGSRVLSKVDFCGAMSRLPTGDTLAMTVNESMLLWDTKRSKPLAPSTEDSELDCRKHSTDVWLAQDRMIRLGDHQGIGVAAVNGGKVTPVWWRDTQGTVHGATASPDGLRIAAICDAKSLCVWDAATGAPQLVISDASRHTSRLVALARSAGGELIVTAAHNGALRMWDLKRGTMSSALDAFTYRTRSSGVITSTESQGKLQQLANASCSYHRELDDTSINVSPIGDSVIADSVQRALLTEKDGRWQSVPGGARGDFSKQAFFAIRNGAVLRKGSVVQPDDSAERVATTLKSVNWVRVTPDGARVALGSDEEVELRSGSRPFALIAGPHRLGRLLAISPSGRCVLGTRGRWCEGDRDISSITPPPGPLSLFTEDDTVSLIGPETFPGFLRARSGTVETTLRRLRYRAGGGIDLTDLAMRGFPPATLQRSDFGNWGVGLANATEDERLLFSWAPHWFARATADGSVEILDGPGGRIALTLRAISGRDAGYILAPDGGYDIVGGDPLAAVPYLRCEKHGVASALADCKGRQVPGLLARVIRELDRVP